MGWTTKPPAGTPLKTGTWHTQNLKSFWSFQEGSGTTLNDLMGYKNLTLYNFADPPTSTSGWNTEPTGIVLAFDGSDDYCASSGAWQGGPPLTVAYWFKANNVSSTAFTVNNAHYLYGFGTFILNQMGARNSVYSPNVYGNTTLQPNIWYHCAIVFQTGTTIYHYLNGVADGSGDSNTFTDYPTTTMYVGRYSNSSNYFFNGRLDDIRIWTRALSSSEIAELYSDRWGIFQDPPISFKSVAGVATENIKSIAGVGINDIKNIR